MFHLALLLACSEGPSEVEPAPAVEAAPAEEVEAAPAGIADPLAHAAEVIALLKAGELSAAAGRFHVAADAQPAEVAAEREGLLTSLAVIDERLGRVMLAKPMETQTAQTYDLRVTSMDADWWAANAQPPPAVAYFEAEFTRGGSGAIRVGYFQVGDQLVMQGIVFGLDATAESRELTIQTLRRMIEAQGGPDDPALLRKLEQSIPPPPG